MSAPNTAHCFADYLRLTCAVIKLPLDSTNLGQEKMVADYVEPLGMRVLIRKDEARQETRGGIVLPDTTEIPTITGRVVEISVQIDRDEDFPVRKYDKVIFHPKNAVPVDFESDNLIYVVPAEDIVAVFRKPPKGDRVLDSANEPDENQ